MPKYDVMAALEVLGAYAEQKTPSASIEARDAAAKELLQEIAALGKGQMADLAAGPVPGYARTTVAIGFSFATVNVTYNPNAGEFIVFVEHGGLNFVPRSGSIERAGSSKARRSTGPGSPVPANRPSVSAMRWW